MPAGGDRTPAWRKTKAGVLTDDGRVGKTGNYAVAVPLEAGFRKAAVPRTGPIVSIVLPCFGQTGVKGGAGTRLIKRKSAGRRRAVTLERIRSVDAFKTKAETKR